VDEHEDGGADLPERRGDDGAENDQRFGADDGDQPAAMPDRRSF